MPKAQAPQQAQTATWDSHTDTTSPAHGPALHQEQKEPSQFLLLTTKSIIYLQWGERGKGHFKVSLLPA